MSEEMRQVVVKMPESLYTALATKAAEKKTSTSKLTCQILLRWMAHDLAIRGWKESQRL